jgi:hypothetical protein
MPRVGFEPMIPESDRPKTAHALYRSATVTGFTSTRWLLLYREGNILCYQFKRSASRKI